MSNIKSIHGGIAAQAGTPNETLVEVIKDLLQLAESGQLQSFIGTGFTGDGLRVVTWADHHPSVYETLGGLAWLQAEFIERRLK
jgi:hypothetical protein